MVLTVLPWFSSSCDKTGYADEREVQLAFSADTVAFDTVFTTVGSTTRQVRVYNRSTKDVKIASITLRKGRASCFRLNVDGDTALVARNVEIQAGDELYFAIEGLLIIDEGATLVVNGSAERPVLFTSLRRDGWYSFLPGQWMAVWFYPGSVNNVIDHAVFEKGTLGLVVDTNVGPNPTLTIRNSVICQMSNTGIMGRGARIVGQNLLLYQCGVATFWARYGGGYSFDHCTFANYWRYGSRENPGVVLNNWYISSDGAVIPRDLDSANFTNCIIYGTWQQGEVLLDSLDGVPFHYAFPNSIVRGGEWDEDPLFVNPDSNDFHLKDDSPAIGIGYPF